ncbi:radical SAM protein [Candidatus Woesearchaeota archaeon]|nr:radical SAM protein [Candidatus Woesearchaeota archaeon]
MAHLVMTTRCNNNCISCINDFSIRAGSNPITDFTSKRDALERESIITIGGGEPTIYSRFFELMQFVRSLEKETLLLTNARAFSVRGFAERFDSIGFDKQMLRISSAFYGHDRMHHDMMTRADGSFEQTLRGIKNLLAMGYKIEIRMILSRMNFRLAKKISEFISEELPGVERVAFINMKVTGEALKNKDILLVPYPKVAQAVAPAVDLLGSKGIEAMLLHFPHCILEPRLWKHTRGRTIDESQIMFKGSCSSCRKKDQCSGIWKSYAELMPLSDFKPIK